MKKFFQVGITLSLICAVAATALALINGITSPRIAEYEKNIVLQALSEVSNGLTIGELNDDTGDIEAFAYYPLTDSQGQRAGYIVQIHAVGYGGTMLVMASYDTAGGVLNAKLLANAETPGLGKKAENAEYMEKFIGTGDATNVPVKKSELGKEDADSIGGSTVTFAGIAKAIAYGSQFVKNLGGK
jgi:Na+-translocating ferredoxin:NAD+ oxidoreductase subunit G